jgi:hypothetical protein
MDQPMGTLKRCQLEDRWLSSSKLLQQLAISHYGRADKPLIDLSRSGTASILTTSRMMMHLDGKNNLDGKKRSEAKLLEDRVDQKEILSKPYL